MPKLRQEVVETSEETQLVDLIWRNFKFKLIVVVATLVTAIAVSSALSGARSSLEQINRESAAARLAWYQKANTKAYQGADDPSSAEVADYAEMAIYDRLLFPLLSKDEKSRQATQLFDSRRKELATFEQRRFEAYNLSLNPPYFQRPVTVNALTILDVWPFVLVFALALTAGIALRQNALEMTLARLVSEGSDTRQHATRRALSGYAAGRLRPAKIGDQAVLVYARSVVLAPEPLVIAALLILIFYFTWRMPETQAPSIFVPRSSLIGYHTVLLAIIALASYVLLKARTSYLRMVAEAAGNHTVLSRTEYLLRRLLQMAPSLGVNTRWGRISLTMACATALASLVLPWMTPTIFGYQLLLAQSPSAQSGNIVFYSLDPVIFSEFRLQLIVALGFLVFMLLQTLVPALAVQRWQKAAFAYAAVLLILAANLVTYLGLLQYGQNRDIVPAVVDMIWPSGMSQFEAPRGLPLLMYNPDWGFAVFGVALLVACTLAMVRLKAIGPSLSGRK